MSRRDLSRYLAPVLFALFNVTVGITGIGAGSDHVPSYAKAAEFMSLNDWAASFIALGLLIPFGMASLTAARVTSAVAIGWWILWSDFIYQALGTPGVSARGVGATAGIASLHILLMPYRRRQRSSGTR